MASLPTLDHQVCEGLAADHSIEDHLESERAALSAERRAAVQRSAPSERWMLIRAAGLGLALAGTIAFGWSQLDRSEPATSCTADGSVTESGETLTRDDAQDCAGVDADGKPVPVDEDGMPTG
ncbi:hypothetical protein ACE2AJ_16895 [Aquihabitans daechungensis]|uniref:hypothetical protein n=1 Tax=Aquihabitans daechungensis TaxID=1052257 RepID=UPI003BA06273